MTEVWKDKDGKVINIGEWDYKYTPVENPDADDLTWGAVKSLLEEGKNPLFLYDEDGKVVMEAKNPLPEGASSEEVEVVSLSDGGKVVADDWLTHRLNAYPNRGDAEDMKFHDAIEGTTTWIEAIQAVKAKYPKE